MRKVEKADQALIAEMGRLLIRRAQAYVDILMKYIFWAALPSKATRSSLGLLPSPSTMAT